MKKGLLVLMMLLLTVPALAVQMTVAEGEASTGVKLDLGGDVRFRGYDFNNFWNFADSGVDPVSGKSYDGDDYETYRLRTRIFTKVSVADNVSGYVRFSNQTYGENVGTGVNTDENVFADNAYIDLTNLFGAPLDLRMGRQDLMYGTGFVIMDGESDAASTAFYFDGFKATLRMSKTAKIDAFYLKDEENNRAEISGGDDVNLMGAYFIGECPVMGGKQEAYALNRTDDGIDKDIWMGGFRLSRTFDSGLNYSAEAAYQWGDAYRNQVTGDMLDQRALGYKLEVGYAVPTDSVKLRPFIGYTSMSGDQETGDTDFEGWDVFYGGWPQFGDLLSWVFVNGPAQFATSYPQSTSVAGECNYSNLNLATLGSDITVGKVKTTLSYTMLTVDDISTSNPNLERDNDYGDYYQLIVTFPYNKYLSFTIDASAIDPGDAFPDSNDDLAHEFFWETNLKF
jgi:hypothetical protein